jgi:ArsR family transcriptional regulator, arsenate/arsenite/antimonite-responsive transcriptional repressor
MSVDMQLAPKHKRPELVPLFDIAQPTLSHHLKKLRDAGLVDSERKGLWAYYYVIPDALKELSAWLR